ncbi:magnesium transporter [Photobacterium sp. BZF1]|uniref:magnesium transporter n=1 Tax=Photobacterium TaxID=657 RepID=UPI001653EC24|nr:magnesium transporter [Photobacterium rosenbergii]MBC7004588.1 magnesium transporter [Photobacterium sp. BZF1]MBY5944077.1 magnesium transporter [Photobacterium rosenbergii]
MNTDIDTPLYSRHHIDVQSIRFLDLDDQQQIEYLVTGDIEHVINVLQHCPHGQVQHLIEQLELIGHSKRARHIAVQLGIILSEAETNRDYLTTSVSEHVLQRIGWIVTLALLGIVSGLIIAQYEDTLSQLVLLAVYMPVIAAAGGNTGSQAATLVIRALATGEVQQKQWLRVALKEFRVGLVLAIAVASVVVVRILIFSDVTSLGDFYISDIALAIAMALFIQIVLSTTLGGVLPIIARVFKLDPAVLVSPMLASIVDISGMWIYFSVVNAILGIS